MFVLSVLFFLGVIPASAHTPHHAIDSLQVSPDYQADSTLFVLVQNNLLKSTNRGATWKQLSSGLDSPYLLSDIAISPDFSADSTMFVSTDGGGVYTSSDRGHSFRQYNNDLRQKSIGLLQVVSLQDYTAVLAAGSQRGLFVSSADSPDWRHVISDDVQILSLLAVVTDSGSYVLAGDAAGGVWKSSSNLDDWRRVFTMDASGGVSALAMRRTTAGVEELYLGTRESGLYRTRDMGKTFDNLSTGWAVRQNDCVGRTLSVPAPDLHVRSVSLGPGSDSTFRIYVSNWHQGVLISSDAGESWSTSDDGVSCDRQADAPAFAVPHFRDLALATEVDWFLAGFDGLYRSGNSGRSWQLLDTMPVNLIRGFDAILNSSGKHSLAIGTYGGGGYTSDDDGDSWSIVNHGLVTTRLSDVQFSPEGLLYTLAKERLLVAAGNERWDSHMLAYSGWRKRVGAGLERRLGFSPKFGTQLFLSDGERGSPWPMQIALSPAYRSDQTAFVGFRRHGVWKSGNAGVSWSRTWDGPTDYVTALQVSPNFATDQTVFAGIRGSGIWVSNDAGDQWRKSDAGFHSTVVPQVSRSFNYVNDPPLQRALEDVLLAVSPEYATDRSLLAGSTAGLFKSSDGGHTWQHIAVDKLRIDAPILALAYSSAFAQDKTVLVSLKGRGLFRSTDGGRQFAPIGRTLLTKNVDLQYLEFSADYRVNGVLFGASNEAVLMSKDKGETWDLLDRPTRYEDWRGAGEGPIRFSAGWSRESGHQYSASTQTITDSVGAVAQLNFFGSKFRWWGEHCPGCGMAEVVIDGKSIATIDLFGEQTRYGDVLTVSDLGEGSHQLLIRTVAARNAQSSGHRVAIDAVDALVQ